VTENGIKRASEQSLKQILSRIQHYFHRRFVQRAAAAAAAAADDCISCLLQLVVDLVVGKNCTY
jgi:hypothetical protein